jgi:glycosyltransferase involved in cell wall biosynthesis
MKISISTFGFSSWGGGIDFVKHVATSLSAVSSTAVTPMQLLLPKDDAVFFLKKSLYPYRSALTSIAKGRIPQWDKWSSFSEKYFRTTFADVANDFQFSFTKRLFKAELAAAQKFQSDVLLPCMVPVPQHYSLPWVGYIYDFQHRHLPHFFTEKAQRTRDKDFATMLHQAKHIVVHAQSVIDDARHFMGDFPATLHALPFSPCPQPAWLEDTLDAREKYGLHQPYFMICNQFWRHKNHATAFRAFATFRKQGGDALLVCTGSTADPRFPEYFASLQKLIQDLGMQNYIRILGHISKAEQISLVKHALAMVQPTLFEGGPGGGAAYDATALGIPVIASDIPVNRGITIGQVCFFPAEDDAALAAALLLRGTSPTVRPSNTALWQEGLARKQQCGKVLLAIAEEAIKDFTC